MESNPEGGVTIGSQYSNAVNSTNKQFDEKQKNKSFFTSQSVIEEERKRALEQVKNDYYPPTGFGGGFSQE